MARNLIEWRDGVMKRANAALDADWPARTGAEFVNNSQWAVGELTAIGTQMQAGGASRVEQSRTFRLLGSLYADLQPSQGAQMLLRAEEAYRAAAGLLEGEADALEAAKLDFNMGNLLRQIDRNDVERLREAKDRVLRARAYFAGHDPQVLGQADAALRSIEDLLRLAPIAIEVERKTSEMDALRKRLAAGEDVAKVAADTHKLIDAGSAASLAGRVQAIVDTLSAEQKADPRFAAIRGQMQELTAKALAGRGPEPQVAQLLTALVARFEAESAGGKVSKTRAATLRHMLDEMSGLLGQDEQGVSSLLQKTQKMRQFVADRLEMAHYLSHGIDRPPEGSRAAVLVELNWLLRRYLLEVMNRPEKGQEEAKEVLELSQRASAVDRRIYESGNDDAAAAAVEAEDLRPLAVAVRAFSARKHWMPAQPIWGGAGLPVDSKALFLSGPTGLGRLVSHACRRSGLALMRSPSGDTFASARWRHLQQALVTVFDWRVETDADRCGVCYELGLALTLGRPVVILVGAGQALPFDIDIQPIELAGDAGDDAVVADAVDRAVGWTYPETAENAWQASLQQVLATHSSASGNVPVEQTLRLLGGESARNDAQAARRIVGKLFDYLHDGKTQLVHPRWPPAYPAKGDVRLFHVMPFRPPWADAVSSHARAACKRVGATYIRGDEVAQPDVVRSIWEEIARASHVLVDLTGLNANVALELGIAHTLGKRVLMVGQDDTADRMFPSVRKLRLLPYRTAQLEQTLGSAVREFLAR